MGILHLRYCLSMYTNLKNINKNRIISSYLVPYFSEALGTYLMCNGITPMYGCIPIVCVITEWLRILKAKKKSHNYQSRNV